ncbi:hypothetical protein BDY19DRAFT_178260 [Irpex rosettiformis]|uniref:Uncharacterized protein n=1 Tax=Irpex rosettiformis TaxID=378272 RepID=A0ACB8U3U2_9APHY|nr:hypothetical protein BDY19DRAFT_178260 [Irpex rosettiformis]
MNDKTDSSVTVPHPLLKEPILYATSESNSYFRQNSWNFIECRLNRCGLDSSKVLIEGERRRGAKRSFLFKSIFHAEMALAIVPWVTMSGGCRVKLSHSPTMENPVPPRCPFPQYVLCESEEIFLNKNIDLEVIFRWFRTAGPLISVRIISDIGPYGRAVQLLYWTEEHANLARLKANSLHKKLQSRPTFSLRTYDPFSIRCTGFGPEFTHKDLVEGFSEYGKIRSSTLENTGRSDAHGIVTFFKLAHACRVVDRGNEIIIGKVKLTVRFEEPEAQHIFHRTFTQKDPHAKPSDGASTEGSEAPPAQPSTDRANSEEQQRKEAATHETAESAEWRAAEARVKTFRDRVLRRETAEHNCVKAREQFEAATTERRNACREYDLAEQAREDADKRLTEMHQACAEAKRVWVEAMGRESRATQQANTARKATENALGKRKRADTVIQVAMEEQVSLRMEMELLDRELAENKPDEETLRKADLATSLRRMQELKRLEEAQKEEDIRRERQAAEERSRREREEAERAAREQREREEAKLREAETRQRLYAEAVAKEQRRCRDRDSKFKICPWDRKLSVRYALERFQLVSEEFDTIRFQESQPLTFASVPWPVLCHPYAMKFEAINWNAVEMFFKAMEEFLEDRTEYKTLIERAHRRFHPDKWRARRTLDSVLDQEVRSQLETAGNVVAQAITSLCKIRCKRRD